VLTESLENLLNRNLGASPAARAICASLRGQRLQIIILGFDVHIAVESCGDSVKLTRDSQGEFAVSVAGSPVNLIALAGPDPERLIRSGAVSIRGDAELLQRYRQLALLLAPDLEDELARLLGDLPAHHISRLARSALSLIRQVGSNAVRNTAEYFAHESNVLVPRAEAEVFLNQVDRLREDVDRAAARLDALFKRMTPNEDREV
jgi:ubiquinone biosynthesis protein UbiJ